MQARERESVCVRGGNRTLVVGAREVEERLLSLMKLRSLGHSQPLQELQWLLKVVPVPLHHRTGLLDVSVELPQLALEPVAVRTEGPKHPRSCVGAPGQHAGRIQPTAGAATQGVPPTRSGGGTRGGREK